MKIYKVTYTSVCIDDGENLVSTTVFIDKNLALRFLKSEILKLKQQEKEFDMDDYCIDEDETSYERYLDGRSMEDSVSIWLDEDETYDEKMMKQLQNEKDKEYEM